MEPMVSQAWLADHLDDHGVRAVDCRYVLGDPSGGRARYVTGHIRGAAFLDVDTDLAAPAGNGSNGRHPLPGPEAFQASARAAGINDDSVVVAYDDNRTGGAARLWWLLRHFGHDRVAVLDGGFEQWTGPVSAGSEDISTGDFTVRPPGHYDLVDATEILERSNGGEPDLVLVDARAPERFRGEVEPIDPVPGRIPGARNVPFTDTIPDDLLSARGDVVVYCGSGVTACAVLLDLAVRGRTDGRLYPGSYSEWATRGLPIERG